MKRLIDRRAALGALASVPVLAVPAVAIAAPVDPISAAIERHRVAYIDLVASLNPADEVKAEEEGRKVTQADEDAHEAASAAEADALDELVETAPTTIGGMRALLEHLVKLEDGCIPNYSGEIAPILLRSPIFAA